MTSPAVMNQISVVALVVVAIVLIRMWIWRRGNPSPLPESPFDYSDFDPLIRLINESNRNWFVTGVAGTGKSTFLRHLVNNCRKQAVVLAPTGLAALNVQGQTIHSFFKFKPDVLDPKQLQFSPLRAQLYRALQLLIIDEVSMVRADLMDAIDVSLRRHRGSNTPFGGCQVVLVGDLFQLPPVVPTGLEEYFSHRYGEPYFFNAPVISSAAIGCLELHHVYRQTDRLFVELLNRVRQGTPTDEDVIRLNERHVSVAGPPSEDTVVLTATNAAASAVNQTCLDRLPGESRVFEAAMSGATKKEYDRMLLKHQGNPDRLEQELDFAFPAPVRLKLKAGAKVIFVRNDSRNRWVNGTVGVVTSVGIDKVGVSVGSTTYDLERETWNKIDYRYEQGRLVQRVSGAFAQYPVRLGWALTVHKAQGKSLDRVLVDLGKGAFAPGQAYVALSRSRTFDGLFLKRELTSKDVFADSRVRAFAASLCSESA